MIRTVDIAFPVMLVFAWFILVINRAGNGPRLQWNRIPGDARYSNDDRVPYVAFVLIALIDRLCSRVEVA